MMDKKSHDEGYRQGYINGFANGKEIGIKYGTDKYRQSHLLTSAILILGVVVVFIILV